MNGGTSVRHTENTRLQKYQINPKVIFLPSVLKEKITVKVIDFEF